MFARTAAAVLGVPELRVEHPQGLGTALESRAGSVPGRLAFPPVRRSSQHCLPLGLPALRGVGAPEISQLLCPSRTATPKERSSCCPAASTTATTRPFAPSRDIGRQQASASQSALSQGLQLPASMAHPLRVCFQIPPPAVLRLASLPLALGGSKTVLFLCCCPAAGAIKSLRFAHR